MVLWITEGMYWSSRPQTEASISVSVFVTASENVHHVHLTSCVEINIGNIKL